MMFSWAKNYPDLQCVCQRFNLTEVSNPKRIQYKPLEGIIQEGPQCGLVGLAIAMGTPNRVVVNRLLQEAQSAKFTYNGEMFSAQELTELAMHNLPNKISLYDGLLNSDEIIYFLLSGGLMLVPYDSDRNHAPCNLRGHKAHWALVIGIIETCDEVYVTAKHGKSKNVAIWNLEDLSQSNAQLEEFSPDRKLQDVDYKLPEDGLGGSQGLKCKAVLIWPID